MTAVTRAAATETNICTTRRSLPDTSASACFASAAASSKAPCDERASASTARALLDSAGQLRGATSADGGTGFDSNGGTLFTLTTTGADFTVQYAFPSGGFNSGFWGWCDNCTGRY